MIQFDLPKEQSSILKVIGIGGGGGNAVNHMFAQNIEGVDFIICNTDAQALASSNVPNKIQLGPHLTQGLGAGANPAIGREATQESLEEIKRILEVNTKMAFITAGMGGGTGTGGAPIISKICKDLDILTVGIVTTPFTYEGKKRMAQAQMGIENLKNNVDTLLVISNDKLRHQFGNLTVKAAFAMADNVLATAAKCITDVINSTGQINVDFADVCTVMRKGGVAILGSAQCEGENRAQKAIEQALNSPLLNDNDIRGAKWILININSSEGEHEFTMDEVDIIQTHLLSQAGEGSDVILGLGYDNNLGNNIGITLIATGFEDEETRQQRETEEPKMVKVEKEVLELKPVEKKHSGQPLFLFDQTEETAVPKKEEPKKEEKKGLREEEVLAALQKDEKGSIAEDLKPELSVTPEPRKSILDLNTDMDDRKPVSETPQHTVYFDLAPEPEERIVPTVQPTRIEDVQKNDSMGGQGIPPAPGKMAPKPTQIHIERPPVARTPIVENKLQFENVVSEEESAEEMKLIEKNPDVDAFSVREEEPVRQTVSIMITDEDEVPLVDEAEEQKRKNMARISRLRNLSYNASGADPHNEFESVPAYMRRNMELHNSIANVESFYKNCTIGSDENSKVKISTINTYLDGKRPD